jgi:tetratricopeptide (TPR) repeat protein
MHAAVRRPGRLITGAILALSVALYAPTLRHGFAFDDDIVIVRNRFLQAPGSLSSLLTHTEWTGGGLEVAAWRPLTDLTYAANYALGGLAPWGYHLANALTHALVALLVFLVARRTGLAERWAAAAALLFAVHPIHVEAVANVTGRKDLLATAFLLSMLLAHRRAVRLGGRRLGWPVLAYLAAMASKEVGAVGLALVLAADLLLPDGGFRAGPQERRRALWLHAAYLGCLVGFLALFRAVAGHLGFGEIPFQDNPAAHATTWVRLLTAVAVLGKGIWLQLLPLGQSPDWSFDAIPLATSLADPRVILTLAALAGWLFVGLRSLRTSPVVLLSVAWYGAALSPAANVLFPAGTIFGERLLYLPSVGLALLAGAALQALAGSEPVPLPRSAPLPLAERGHPPAAGAAGVRARRLLLPSTATACALLAVATLRYESAWGDELRLFRWAAESAPRSTKVHHKLATLLLAADRPGEALAEADRALALLPSNSRARVARAAILGKLGRTAEQEADLRRALVESPQDPDAAYALGGLERDAGRLDDAAALWRRALALRPLHSGALSDLATYHLLRAELGAAMEFAQRAVEADPACASGWYALGMIHRSRGDALRSRQAFQRFVETAGADYAAEAAGIRAKLASGEL